MQFLGDRLVMDTPTVEKSKLDEDKEGKTVDPSHYRGMIGTLLYLTSSRPDLQFAICMCARYQAWPTKKHLHAGFAVVLAVLITGASQSRQHVDTPMMEKSKLDEDKEGKAADPSHYRGMIGTLFYLTASKPDL
nr:retrovirus-related Pol polyprotein from transposon TNT 1-94 [Tanacetum cinerariifolium]